jgi:hypothetical protein
MNAKASYSPRVSYLCDDSECCWNACPVVTCRGCGEDWPCPDYRAAHTDTQVAAQERYVERKSTSGP